MGRTKVELVTDVLEDVRDSSPITIGACSSRQYRLRTGNFYRTKWYKRFFRQCR